MEANDTMAVKEFILLAFSNAPQFQVVLFPVVLLMYIVCIIGNVVTISLVITEPILQTPMYFFIRTFSLLEIMFVSVPVPKLLDNLLTESKTISFAGCFSQLYAFNAFGEIECLFLTLMVFDRHLAIHNPLRYSAIMNHSLCIELTVLLWATGFIMSSIVTVSTASLEFCGPNEVDHFFCDLAPLQNLSCSNPFLSVLATSFVALLTVVIPFIVIMGFYIHIIYTVSKIKSLEGKQKAFSTCSSHLIVVGLFYGSAITVYMKPKGSKNDKFLALMYSIVTPMCNPFIYTFRNREIKNVLTKSIRQFLK
ncbi:olfactory receptor 10A7-like [Pelodytes ibericus]